MVPCQLFSWAALLARAVRPLGFVGCPASPAAAHNYQLILFFGRVTTSRIRISVRWDASCGAAGRTASQAPRARSGAKPYSTLVESRGRSSSAFTENRPLLRPVFCLMRRLAARFFVCGYFSYCSASCWLMNWRAVRGAPVPAQREALGQQVKLLAGQRQAVLRGELIDDVQVLVLVRHGERDLQPEAVGERGHGFQAVAHAHLVALAVREVSRIRWRRLLVA